MPQYLMSVWHDDDYDVDFTVTRRNGRRPGRRLNEELSPPAPGCSAPASTQRRRPPSCAPLPATSR